VILGHARRGIGRVTMAKLVMARQPSPFHTS
jgi:hypothetical protein